MESLTVPMGKTFGQNRPSESKFNRDIYTLLSLTTRPRSHDAPNIHFLLLHDRLRIYFFSIWAIRTDIR